jgi:hypothetical protein
MGRRLRLPFGCAGLAALCFAGCTGGGDGSPSTSGGPDGDSPPSDGAATDSANGGETATAGDANRDGPTTTSEASTGVDAPIGDGPACPVGELPSPMCNAIVASGPRVTTTFSSGTVPESGGGVVPDGTYVLESSTFYDGTVAPEMFQTTWLICGDQWDVGYNVTVDGGELVVHADYTATVQGSEVALKPTCASVESVYASLTFGFSVLGGGITFSQDVQGLVLVSSFSRQ